MSPQGEHIKNWNWCQKYQAHPTPWPEAKKFQMIFLGLWPGGWANQRLMTMFYALTLFYGVTWTVKGTSWWQLKQRSDTAPALSVDCLACYGELFNWIFLITICEEGEREWQSSWTMNAIRTVYRQNKRITSKRDCLTRMRKEGGFLCIWFLQLRTLMIHMELPKQLIRCWC